MEAEAFRVGAEQSLREAHAFRTMLAAHNIDLSSVTPEALAGLVIRDGKVVSDFAYTPPKAGRLQATGPASLEGDDQSAGLTYAEVMAMSREEINARWEEVQPVLAAGGGGR